MHIVARLLAEKGYIATIVRGNAPETDILARVPNGKSFSVEVKSMKKENTWRFKKPTQNTDFWFFVITDSKEPIISIMTGEEVSKEWADYYQKSCEKRKRYNKIKIPENSTRLGTDKKTIQRYNSEDKWDKLSSFLK